GTAFTTKPAFCRAVVAAGWGWPTTLGTATCTGPLLTTSTSCLLLLSLEPGGGLVVITLPTGTGLVCCCDVTLLKPRPCSSVVAAAAGLPTTSDGTVRVFAESHHPSDRPRKKSPRPSNTSNPIIRAISHHFREGSSV